MSQDAGQLTLESIFIFPNSDFLHLLEPIGSKLEAHCSFLGVYCFTRSIPKFSSSWYCTWKNPRGYSHSMHSPFNLEKTLHWNIVQSICPSIGDRLPVVLLTLMIFHYLSSRMAVWSVFLNKVIYQTFFNSCEESSWYWIKL